MTDIPPLERLIAALQHADLFDHPVQRFELLETHISYVLLTGPYAYKLKKPLDLGFLDFSTLEKRREYCTQELRLNRRLAPQIYLEVVPITGRVDAPRLNGPGAAIEYAVKMVQFPPADQLDRLTRRRALKERHVDQIADTLASFHAEAPTADPDSDFGTPETVAAPVRQNFAQLGECCADASRSTRLEALRAWSERTLARAEPAFGERRAAGAVRECHGDLHLGNMVLYRGQVVIFDCIEFNPALRWIDTISDTAFLVMDLHFHELPRLARRFLNRYLELSGDYAGLAVLDHYLAYRAMVRAKVACIRARQDDASEAERAAALEDMDAHLALARRMAHRPRPRLLIMHGLSGAGKTAVSAELVAALGAVRVRSDVERKRLAGLAGDQRSGSGLNSGLYTQDMSDRTYTRLSELARTVIRAGYSVVVDAAFLQRARRRAFEALAQELSAAFSIVDVRCATDELRRRITARAAAASDASEAGLDVLDQQLRSAEPLEEDELGKAVVVATDGDDALGGLAAALQAVP